MSVCGCSRSRDGDEFFQWREGEGGGGAWDGGGFRRCGTAAVILRLKTLFLPPLAVLEAVEIEKPSVQMYDDVSFR